MPYSPKCIDFAPIVLYNAHSYRLALVQNFGFYTHFVGNLLPPSAYFLPPAPLTWACPPLPRWIHPCYNLYFKMYNRNSLKKHNDLHGNYSLKCIIYDI